ncbi:unnamed protein product, partial [Dicrocoelium dendriticum]
MHRCCLFVWLALFVVFYSEIPTETVAGTRGCIHCLDLNTSTKHNAPLSGNGWIILTLP